MTANKLLEVLLKVFGGITEPLRVFRWEIFAWGFIAAAAGHWLAMGLLHELLHVMNTSEDSVLLALVSLVLTFVFAIILFHLHHKNPWPRSRTTQYTHLILAWCVFATGLWFAKTTEAAMIPWVEPLGIIGLGAFGLFLFTPRYTKLRDEFQGVRNIERQEPGDRFHSNVLILFLSTPNVVPEVLEAKERSSKGYHTSIPLRENSVAILKGVALHEDIEAISKAAEYGRPWNWQQVLRSVQPFGGLQSIWIFGSQDAGKPGASKFKCPEHVKDLDPRQWPPGTTIEPRSGKGSHDFLPLCRDMIGGYTDAEINLYPQPLDFEDFEGLFSAVSTLLREELADIPPERIMVDVTGGMKVTSIVAAILTQNRGTRFQYVETQPDFEVIPYRLVNEKAPNPHGH